MEKSKKKTIPTVSDIDPGKNEFGSKETEIPLTLSMEKSQEAMEIFTVSPLHSPTSVNVLFKESARFILKRSDNFLSSKLFQSLKRLFLTTSQHQGYLSRLHSPTQNLNTSQILENITVLSSGSISLPPTKTKIMLEGSSFGFPLE